MCLIRRRAFKSDSRPRSSSKSPARQGLTDSRRQRCRHRPPDRDLWHAPSPPAREAAAQHLQQHPDTVKRQPSRLQAGAPRGPLPPASRRRWRIDALHALPPEQTLPAVSTAPEIAHLYSIGCYCSSLSSGAQGRRVCRCTELASRYAYSCPLALTDSMVQLHSVACSRQPFWLLFQPHN